MIDEAEVFLRADEAAVEVFTSIHDDRWDTVLPPVFDMPGADQPAPLRDVVDHYAYDNAWVPDMLAGAAMDEVGRDRFDGDLLGADPADAIRRISAAAAAAAGRVSAPSLVVHCSYGDCPVPDYFWQLNIARSLTAHDVAAAIGLDYRLPEELCQAMYDGTQPTVSVWRSFGVYREQVPVPEGASWRERFLGLTGRRNDRNQPRSISDTRNASSSDCCVFSRGSQAVS